jgi:hypothetical protein
MNRCISCQHFASSQKKFQFDCHIFVAFNFRWQRNGKLSSAASNSDKEKSIIRINGVLLVAVGKFLFGGASFFCLSTLWAERIRWNEFWRRRLLVSSRFKFLTQRLWLTTSVTHCTSIHSILSPVTTDDTGQQLTRGHHTLRDTLPQVVTLLPVKVNLCKICSPIVPIGWTQFAKLVLSAIPVSINFVKVTSN